MFNPLKVAIHYFAVPGVVEGGVRGEDQEATGAVAPADPILAHNGLHDGVKAALGRVQVARHGRSLHLGLELPRLERIH